MAPTHIVAPRAPDGTALSELDDAALYAIAEDRGLMQRDRQPARDELLRRRNLPPPPEPEPVPDPEPATETADDAWEPPTPFYAVDVPPFPVDALPDWVAAQVEAVAEAMQTPPDLSAMAALSGIATACQRKVEVHPRPGWREPLSLYAVTTLDSGERKTVVMQMMTQPVRDFEAIEIERLRPEYVAKQNNVAMLKARLESLRQAYARAKEQDQRDGYREADEFAAELLMPEPFLRRDVSTLGLKAPDLAQRYQVSEQAMWIQLINLKIASQYSHR